MAKSINSNAHVSAPNKSFSKGQKITAGAKTNGSGAAVGRAGSGQGAGFKKSGSGGPGQTQTGKLSIRSQGSYARPNGK